MGNHRRLYEQRIAVVNLLLVLASLATYLVERWLGPVAQWFLGLLKVAIATLLET